MKRALTGVQPTGTLHIGNYVGAIRPVLDLAANPQFTTNIFIADYHALNNANERPHIMERSRAIAATFLALGLDPAKVTFYRQSDVPETFEMTSFLSNFTPKGLMNRAHAYKAATQANRERKVEDEDIGINMGLYLYPLLMTADIVLFDADVVPVGHDQKQHIEFARDISGSVNAAYGKPVLKQPDGLISEATMELPGTDGRKMSKSYGNIIPIFAPREEVEKACMKVKTDSKLPAEPKDADNLIVRLYAAMADKTRAEDFKKRFLPGGMGYGDAKKELAKLLEETFSASREKYNALMADPVKIDTLLLTGAEKARELAKPVLRRMREAAGFKVG